MDRHRTTASTARRAGLAAGVFLLGTLFALPSLADGRAARRAVDDGRVRAEAIESGWKHGRHGKHGNHAKHCKHCRKRGRGHGAWHDHRRHRDHRYYDRGHYRYDRHRYDRHRHGHASIYVDVPLRLGRRDFRYYADWYDGAVWYDAHRHRHRVYRFPYRTRHGVRYRPYEYCDGRLYDRGRGYIAYRDDRFSIELGF